MPRWPRGLAGLIILAAISFGCVTIGLGAAMYGIVHETIEAQLDDRIGAEADALLAAGHKTGHAGVAAAVRAREASHSAGDLGYIVLGPSGRRIAGTLKASLPPPGYFEFLRYEYGDGTIGIAQAVNRPITGGGRLVVAVDRGPVVAMDRIIFLLFAVTVGFMFVLGLAGAIGFGRTVQRRLSRISDAAEAIVAGDFSRRMPMTGALNDFDRLSAVINRMLDRIEILLENLRKVSADIAHDIRSPLNRLRGRLENPIGTDRHMVMQDAIADVDDLLDLVESVLAISELEGSAVRRRFAPVDLMALAADMADGYRSTIEAADMRISVSGPATCHIMGDAALLRRGIANLLDNAILHTRAGTSVDLAVRMSHDEVVLTVADDGPGVGEADRARIFDRFVRLDRSRSKSGHGLGLNLLAAIAHAHMGSAAAIPSAAGLTVELRLLRLPAR